MYDGINIKEQSIVDAHYTDFRSITEDALLFDAKTLKLELRDNPTSASRSTNPFLANRKAHRDGAEARMAVSRVMCAGQVWM